MSSQTESGESDADISCFCCPREFLGARSHFASPSSVFSIPTFPPMSESVHSDDVGADGGLGGDWTKLKLDHLTRQFQEMCFVARTSPTPSTSVSNAKGGVPGANLVGSTNNAVIPRSAIRRTFPEGTFFGVDEYGDPRFVNFSLDSEHCFHLTQPGSSGFKMFLRMSNFGPEASSKPFRAFFRSRSSHSGRSSDGGCCSCCDGLGRRSGHSWSRCSFRSSPYYPTEPLSGGGAHRRISTFARRLADRLELLHPSSRIPEDDFECGTGGAPVQSQSNLGCDTSPDQNSNRRKTRPRAKHYLSLEEILRDGAKLPSVAGLDEARGADEGDHDALVRARDLQQSKDIDRVVKGLKYLAVE